MSDDYEGGGLDYGMLVPPKARPPAKPTAEVVPAMPGVLSGQNYALPRSEEWLCRGLSPETIRAMLSDPAVASSYNSHRMGILSGGVELVGTVKQPAWSKRPAQNSPRGEFSGPGAKPKALTPEQQLAKDVLEFDTRCVARVRDSLLSACFQLLDAMGKGCALAEVTFKVADDGGPDHGRLVFSRFAVKPSWAWRFVVDRSHRVVGILTYDAQGQFVVYPPDKFVWLSWMPRDSDPRGTSLLRAAHEAWNLKRLAWPNHYRHLVRFGSPGLDFEMAENDTTLKPAIDAAGAYRDDGTLMEPGVFYATQLGVYQSGGIFVHPSGSVLKVVEPVGNGDAFTAAIDLYDRQIKLAIEYQTRASLEAKHGSKADSASAENEKDKTVDFGRDWLADGLFPAFKLLNRLNFGDEAAELYTPRPTFGGTSNANQGELIRSLAAAGYTFGPSQMEDLDDLAGVAIRDSEADAQMAAEQMQAQADLAAKSAPPGGKPPAAKGGPK